MTRLKKGFIGYVSPKKNRVSQIYPDTYLKVYTCDNQMHAGNSRQGVLTMVEDFEKFEFVEQEPVRYKRNPKVWMGDYIIVHRDKKGIYQVHFRRMEMRRRFNPVRVAKGILAELLTAIKALGL